MLYAEGERILEMLDSKKGTVKGLCLNSKIQNKKQLFALVCETLKYRPVLHEIIDATKLLRLERSLSPLTTQLLVHDFLFGRGIHSAPRKLKDAVLKHKCALKSQLARIKIKAHVTNNKDLISERVNNEVILPRYVRVNLLKTTMEDVIEHFKREDYTYLGTRGFSYTKFIDVISKLKPKQFLPDINIPELLVFAAKTDLHDHILYTSGAIILQDKASCIPAHVLNPRPGSHVIDCCAAPGNKTTHVANLLNNKGRIFSFDLDGRRLSTMATLTARVGVLCTELIHSDFLRVNPKDSKYTKVTHAIVDPSCSGSGILSRLNSLTDNEGSSSDERLEKLAGFQKSVLSHALSFPAMQRVVYSTCSVHTTENEDVVKHVLTKYYGEFRLVSILEEMPGHREGGFPGSRHCLKLEPGRDRTNGFFVACFERVRGGGGGAGYLPPDEEAEVVVETKVDVDDGVDIEIGQHQIKVATETRNNDSNCGQMEHGGQNQNDSTGEKRKRKRNHKKKTKNVENQIAGAEVNVASGKPDGAATWWKHSVGTEGDVEFGKKVKLNPITEFVQKTERKKKKQKKRKRHCPVTV